MTRLAVVLTVAALALGAVVASAHGLLERAEPRAGSKVKTSPPEVRLHFTERLEPAYSSVRVVNSSGERVDRGDVQLGPSNLSLLRVSLPPLAPGTYKVFWRVLSVDSHVTEGEFTFRVQP